MYSIDLPIKTGLFNSLKVYITEELETLLENTLLKCLDIRRHKEVGNGIANTLVILNTTTLVGVTAEGIDLCRIRFYKTNLIGSTLANSRLTPNNLIRIKIINSNLVNTVYRTSLNIPGHVNYVCSVATSPNNKLLCQGAMTELSSYGTSKQGKLHKHSGGIISVKISPDNRFIVSGSKDTTVKYGTCNKPEHTEFPRPSQYVIARLIIHSFPQEVKTEVSNYGTSAQEKTHRPFKNTLEG